jgi:hypothetical protein
MRLLRAFAPVVCVLAVVVTRPAPFAGFSAGLERTLHRGLGDDNILCRLYLDPHDKFTRVVPPRRAAFSIAGAPESNAVLSNITVNYTGFTGAKGAAAQVAFQAAVDIWKTQVASTVPIVVDAEFLDICAAYGQQADCGLLGTAGSSALRDASENPMPATWYPFPLLNKIAGIDVGAKYFTATISNIGAEFDSARNNWYFGTDGQVPSEMVDFESVVLHELGHGLGFFGFASVSQDGLGTVGRDGFPYIYDRSVVDHNGAFVINNATYPNGSVALGTLLTSGGSAGSQSTGTFWGGANGKAANGGVLPKLYAPSQFQPGSSHSHLDEVKFAPGNINSLMTPALSFAEAIHTPGPIMLGMFADMGWGATCSFVLDRATATVATGGGTVKVTLSTGTGCNWNVSTTAGFISIAPATTGSGSQIFTLTVAANGAASARTATVTIGGQNLQIIQNGTGPTMTLDKSSLIFGAVTNGVAFTGQTPAQIVRMVQSAGASVSWTATPSQPWLLIAKGSDTPSTQPVTGNGSVTFTITTQFASGLQPTQSGSITLAFTGAGNLPGPITVTLNVLQAGQSTAPFGSFDTPVDQSIGITGSVAVTGWAMDDIAVTRVEILRQPVSGEGTALVRIGDATIVDGARPDVAATFPSSPQNTRAGWGYLMLTNFLPNLGDGTYTLVAVAYDADGHATTLGSKTITCNNSSSEDPFGAIDTPEQGGTADGITANYGWVLARGSTTRADPPGGGTVRVVIDGAAIASVPGGWTSRSDLDALFPAAQYAGIGTAFGVAGIDTTTLTNGVHTIAWGVTATNGRAAGIGSRYFTVSNGSGVFLDPQDASVPASTVVASPAMIQMPRAAALRSGGSIASLASEIAAATQDARAITGRRGYDPSAAFRRYHAAKGVVTVQSEELDRIELRLGGGQGLTGYMRSGDALVALPIGSALNAVSGVFTWQPGAGFVGAYDLVFVRWGGGRAVSRQDVRVVLNPRGSNRVGPQVMIDLPSKDARDVDARSFIVAGWAADLDSNVDAGVDTVHVWAYPQGGGDPIFIGAAAFGGSRPDVAAVYGDRFGKSGYGIEIKGLPRGTYDIAVFAYSTVADEFVPAKIVTVRVR